MEMFLGAHIFLYIKQVYVHVRNNAHIYMKFTIYRIVRILYVNDTYVPNVACSDHRH